MSRIFNYYKVANAHQSNSNKTADHSLDTHFKLFLTNFQLNLPSEPTNGNWAVAM